MLDRCQKYLKKASKKGLRGLNRLFCGVPARKPGWSLEGGFPRIRAFRLLRYPGLAPHRHNVRRDAGINLAGAASRAHSSLVLSGARGAGLTNPGPC